MKGLRIEMQAQIDVIFSDEEKAAAFFIDGSWKDCFWDIDDLEDLAKNIANAVHNVPERWIYNDETGEGYHHRSPEGFGDYIKQPDGSYLLENDEVGNIRVSYEMELEPMDATEIDLPQMA